ncbi:MAG TPA: ABC-2 family transporter protein [Candidatus Nanoarchaeia archaeon]|nr:ABC-2 family transporter protein [Candidatus Nanoarchaeia archaeon]
MVSIGFWKSALGLNIASQMIYRLNFFLNVVVMLMFNLTFPLLTLLIYTNSAGFPDWSSSEILLFQGFAILLWGLEQFLLSNVSWELNRIMRDGQFDRLMVSPAGPLQFLVATNLAIEVIPQVLLGIGIVSFAFFNLGVLPSLRAWLLLILFIALGLLFMVSLIVIQMSLIIRFVQVRRLGELVRILSLFGQYPANIYSKGVQAIVVGAIPFALVAFFPAKVLLGTLGEFPYFAVAAAIAFGVIAYLSWSSSMKKYTSAGG